MQELIDKQETLKKKCETCGYCESLEKAMRATHPDFVADKCNAYKFLAEQPTIEPEARHGRWIYVGEETMHDGWTYRKYKCSECGFQTVEAINYCQNCGRDMRETDTNVGGK